MDLIALWPLTLRPPFRRLCRRCDRIALCLHLLPAALPSVSPHRLPPALRQPGAEHHPACASLPGGASGNRQCHQPASGGHHRGARMTNGPLLLHRPLGMTHTDWLTLVHSSGSSSSWSVHPSLILFLFPPILCSVLTLGASFGKHSLSVHLLMANMNQICVTGAAEEIKREEDWL